MAKDDGFFINLGTLTIAHKAEKFLKENKIKTTVGKKALLSSDGCSWGVFVSGSRKDEVITLLRTASFKIL
ncbi:MAG: hypothetical protein IIW20_04585 [Clostridia bacterium]|nr:hypothetical protein [Clostridia bacterium]